MTNKETESLYKYMGPLHQGKRISDRLERQAEIWDELDGIITEYAALSEEKGSLKGEELVKVETEIEEIANELWDFLLHHFEVKDEVL